MRIPHCCTWLLVLSSISVAQKPGEYTGELARESQTRVIKEITKFSSEVLAEMKKTGPATLENDHKLGDLLVFIQKRGRVCAPE